jgi:hypothetical protein
MLAILVMVVGSLTILVMLMLVIVVIGIRQEPVTEELNEQAPSLIAAFVRRLLGAYVRKPDSLPNLDWYDEGRACSHTTPLVGPMGKRRR